MSLNAALRGAIMTKLKHFLRVVIKIVFTPIIVPLCVLVISVFSFLRFYEWLGDREDYISREILSEWKEHLKQWFTTL